MKGRWVTREDSMMNMTGHRWHRNKGYIRRIEGGEWEEGGIHIF